MTAENFHDGGPPTARVHSRGWWALAAAIAGAAFSPATLINVPFGVFLLELQGAFGWGRAEISLALTIFMVALIATLPFVGALLDRFGTRRVLLVSIPAYALALISLGWLDGSMVRLYVTFGALGVLSAGAQSLTYVTMLSLWFDHRRGLAIGLCMAGFGIGYIVVPQAVRWLIDDYGWRLGYAGMGVLALVGAFLPALAWARQPGCQAGAVVRESEAPSAELQVREAVKTAEFWLLAGTFALASFALNGVQSQLVPLLRGNGMAPAMAIVMLSAIGIGSSPGRIVAGYLMDRIFAPRVVVWFFLLSIVGIAVLMFGKGGNWIFLAAVCVGLSLGAENDALGFIAGRYFGLQALGRIYSLLLCAYLVGAALGPLALAASYDATGSYDLGLQAGMAAMVAASILLLLLKRKRYAAR